LGVVERAIGRWIHLPALGTGWKETADDLVGAWRGNLHATLPADAHPSRRDIADRLFMDMFPEMQHNLVISAIGALLLVIAIGFVSPSVPLLAWGVWAGFTFIGGLAEHTRFMRNPPAGTELVTWKVGYRRGIFVAGLMWGTVMFLPLPPDAIPYMAIAMLLVIAGAVSLFSMDRPAISLLAVPCGLLTGLSLMRSGDLLGALTGLGFIFAVALVVRLARVHNAAITEALVIAEERKGLLEQLGEQRRQAEQANAAKTTFLAAVSHDLRQPMHSIALLAAAARQRGHAEADVVEQIDASVQSMDNLLGALLEVSKLDSGTVPLQFRRFAVAEVLEPVRLKFDAQARAKGLRLEVEVPSPKIHSDLFQLERIVSNLTANAIRYTARGEVRIRCRLRGDTLWVQVWDTGIGIARRHRPQVFDEFFQVSRTPHRSGQDGLGLGLSIVRRAAQRLGHGLRLRSREGRGSMFEVGVPLATPEDVHAAQLAALLDGLLILVIEDDPAVRQGMVSVLTAFDCHVLGAGSVAEAVAVADGSLRLPDLIVSNYRFADGGTGLEAIAQVRAAAMEAIPAVIVTAEPGGRPADAPAPPADIPVLSKPLRAEALVSALMRLGDFRRAR
jgi:signal transduction histidine kinase